MTETFVLAFLIFLLIGVAVSYRDSGFVGALFWGPALALLLITSCFYILIISGGVAAVKALIDSVGKVVA